MRYYDAEEVSFTNSDGKTANVKDTIPIQTKAESFLKVNCAIDVSLDEIASRPNLYGEDAESNSYKIFDENVVEIFESRFNMGAIKTLRVPV